MQPRDARDAAAKPPDGSPQPPRRLDAHLAEYARDPALWPVLLVAGAIFVTLGTALLIAAVRLRNTFALAALALLVVVTLDVVWRDVRRRRLGAASRIVLALWTLSAAATGFAVWRGWV